ncbi:MAG: protein kinase, partial [Thiohalomonadales bacterium]
GRDVLPEGFELHWYKVQSVLGRGAFGVTYLAHDQNLDQLVAIKEYFPNEFASRVTGYTVHPITGEQSSLYDWGLDRFLKEARILAKFKHPNIVRVFSVFEQNNTAYMVMEYERGQELSVLFKSHKRLSEDQLLSIYLPIAAGLQLVHDAGFIHRDIKPSNIYIRHNDSSPVLIDFGAARNVSGSETRSLTSLVTQGYAPFEQFNTGDEKQGPWTDIYALGASLFYGVTGKLPIDSMARGSSLLSNGIDPYQPANKLAAGRYSARLLNAIDAALMFQPRDRPQDIAAWVALLSSGTNPTNAAQSKSMSTFDDDATVIVPRQATGRGSANNISRRRDQRDITQLPTENKIHSNLRQPRKRHTVLWLSVSVITVTVSLVIGTMMFARNKPSTPPQQGIAQVTPPVTLDVKPLLIQAGEAQAQGDLFTPAKKSAIFYYQAVLRLDSDNPTALRAIKKIVNLYSDGISSDISENYIEEAQRKIDILNNAKVDAILVAKLQKEIDVLVTRDKDIGDWLQQAKKYLAKGKRVAPEGNNALFLYRRVLSVASDNQEAQKGIDEISRYYIARAKKNLNRGKLDKVIIDLKLVASIDPQSTSLIDLQRQVKRKKNAQKRVSQQLLQAQRALQAGNLIQPSRKNAYYYYNQVYIKNQNNAKARSGMTKVLSLLQAGFDKNIAAQSYDQAESLLMAIELSLPGSPLANGLRRQFSKNSEIQQQDIAVINELIGNFKLHFEARDTQALREVTVFNPDVEKFLGNFFGNYPSFRLDVTNLEFIGKKRLGIASLKITNLINKQGSKIEPGDWSRFKIVAQRNNEGQWKIFWGENAL